MDGDASDAGPHAGRAVAGGLALPLRETARDAISAADNTGTVVQVPPAGQPIVLLPSRQSVGGYPRLAAVVTADLGRFTQMRPGDKVRFAEDHRVKRRARIVAGAGTRLRSGPQLGLGTAADGLNLMPRVDLELRSWARAPATMR